MKILFSSLLAISMLIGSSVQAQVPLLPDGETMLLTVFLKHDQTMNNSQRGELLEKTGFNDTFPPEGVEIVDHYVMMGIGQVIVLRMPPDHLRRVAGSLTTG